MDDQSEPTDYFAAWTRSYAIPSAVVLDDMTLIWANAAAHVLLRGNAFFVADGALLCAERSQDAAFRSFVLRSREEPEAWAMRKADGGHLIVRAERLAPTGLPPATALMFHDAAAVRHVWADIGDIFGLTPAEVAIIKRMLAGASADQIAEILDISLETVRTHVRRIYTKVGASNREQLFSTVSPFRVI